MLDVNNTDAESDLWVPAREFIELDLLKSLKTILSDKGAHFLLKTGLS